MGKAWRTMLIVLWYSSHQFPPGFSFLSSLLTPTLSTFDCCGLLACPGEDRTRVCLTLLPLGPDTLLPSIESQEPKPEPIALYSLPLPSASPASFSCLSPHPSKEPSRHPSSCVFPPPPLPSSHQRFLFLTLHCCRFYLVQAPSSSQTPASLRAKGFLSRRPALSSLSPPTGSLGCRQMEPHVPKTPKACLLFS